MLVPQPASISMRVCRELDRPLTRELSRRVGHGIGIAGIAIVAAAMLTTAADARSFSVGVRTAPAPRIQSFRGVGSGRSFSVPRAGRSFSAPRAGRAFSAPKAGHAFSAPKTGHAFSGPKAGHAFSAQKSNGARVLGSHGPATASGARLGPGANSRFAARSVAAPGSVARSVTRGQAALGNRVITNTAWRRAMAPVRFHGRFIGSAWPWWYGGIVIGWAGPVFWPYVYDDFYAYVFWPYVYDDFWLYAYDDVYYGIYGPYAYVDPLPRAAARRPVRTAGPAGPAGPTGRAAGVCSNRASELTGWPIGRIVETVQPTEAQRAALDALKEASTKAVDMLKNACPQELPTIPTGRLEAMETRLEVMLEAVKTVRPALDTFYQSLSDEQKGRFNTIAPANQAAATKDQRDFTQLCDARSPGVTDLPVDRIAGAIGPTESQRAALDELRDAMITGGSSLKSTCSSYQALTPVGRVEAMEQRLEATLAATRTVKPALAKFYDMLSDEQKAKFNALRSAGAST